MLFAPATHHFTACKTPVFAALFFPLFSKDKSNTMKTRDLNNANFFSKLSALRIKGQTHWELNFFYCRHYVVKTCSNHVSEDWSSSMWNIDTFVLYPFKIFFSSPNFRSFFKKNWESRNGSPKGKYYILRSFGPITKVRAFLLLFFPITSEPWEFKSSNC